MSWLKYLGLGAAGLGAVIGVGAVLDAGKRLREGDTAILPANKITLIGPTVEESIAFTQKIAPFGNGLVELTNVHLLGEGSFDNSSASGGFTGLGLPLNLAFRRIDVIAIKRNGKRIDTSGGKAR